MSVHLAPITQRVTMHKYFLSPHVHYCIRGETAVILDLHRDDYLLVNGNAAALLQPLSPCSLSATDGLQELLSSGLLTTDRTVGRPIRATEVDPGVEQLVDPDITPRSRIDFLHVLHFISACTTAAARLRWGSLEHTVNAVARRKLRDTNRCNTIDLDRARGLTSIFHRLRFFYPRSYLCLYDSLALLDFLACYRVYPTWIFGIRLEPWAAHCWVQEAGFVFNDDVEEALNYTPIMAV